jgi:hypothetical protein
MNKHKKQIQQRTYTTREVTFTCGRCGSTVTIEQFPGAQPKYCEDCRPIVKREQARERMRKYRARKSGQ